MKIKRMEKVNKKKGMRKSGTEINAYLISIGNKRNETDRRRKSK